MNNWTRKDFLKVSAAGAGAALLTRKSFGQAPAVAKAGTSANGDIRVAVVGFNKQGNGHMSNYLPGHQDKLEGATLVALCDVDPAVLAKGKERADKAGLKIDTYSDYRKLLENPNIDAVVIATPNHNHSLHAIWGLQAGKDVYVEKPLSHNVWEGRQVVEAAKKYSKNVIVAGTQNRSSEDIAYAIEMLRSGKLGKIKWARGLCYKQRDAIGKTTGDQPIPKGLDYDKWSGPAPLVAPRRNSPANGTIHYDWHWFWNYGGGDITNQGIHQMDVARWMLGAKGLPKSVQSFGGRFGYQDDAETPNTLISVFEYDEAPLIFEVRGLPRKTGMRAMDVYRVGSIGVTIQAENGYIYIGENGSGGVYDNENKRVEGLAKGGLKDHRKNWIKAVQTRKVTNGLVEECHYSSSLCHLGNVSYLVGSEKANTEVAEAVKGSEVSKEAHARMLEHLKVNDVAVDTTKTVLGPLLKIDGAKEKFVGPDATIVAAAHKSPLFKREGRGDFKIPVMQSAAVAGS